MKKAISKIKNLKIEEILVPIEMKSIKGGACWHACVMYCKEGCSHGRIIGTKTELLEQN